MADNQQSRSPDAFLRVPSVYPRARLTALNPKLFDDLQDRPDVGAVPSSRPLLKHRPVFPKPHQFTADTTRFTCDNTRITGDDFR